MVGRWEPGHSATRERRLPHHLLPRGHRSQPQLRNVPLLSLSLSPRAVAFFFYCCNPPHFFSLWSHLLLRTGFAITEKGPTYFSRRWQSRFNSLGQRNKERRHQTISQCWPVVALSSMEAPSVCQQVKVAMSVRPLRFICFAVHLTHPRDSSSVELRAHLTILLNCLKLFS